jgi:hypothetical protein
MARGAEKKPEYGPAMLALTPLRRRFVEALLTGPPGHGALTRAAIAAGASARNKNRHTVTKNAHILSRDPKVILALQEEGRKIVRGSGYIAAVNATMALVHDPTHREHGRALSIIFDRVDPLQTHHLVDVQHHVVVDHDAEMLAQYRACKAIGASRDKLESLFGYSGLMRLEQRDLAEQERNGAAPKLIEAIVIKESVVKESVVKESVDG